uniref:Neur_chan_LBD domain-containing protein n=1 Tax=Schistosoma mansoni TaxID=6183 RepID=A0A5K4FCR6_SCHMA
MDRNIHLSISDHELILDKYDLHKRDQTLLLKHTNSLPIEEYYNLDPDPYHLYHNQYSNSCYAPIQHNRSKSYQPRMVTRSSINYRNQLKHSLSNKFYSNIEQKNLIKLNNKPLYTTNNTTHIPTLHNTYNTTYNTTTDNNHNSNMDSQLLSSSLSPEFMGNSSKESNTTTDDLLLNKRTSNYTTNNTTNKKYIKNESKLYSTIITPIPLISYQHNIIPNNIDIYPNKLDNSSISINDKRLSNINNNDNSNENILIERNRKSKVNIGKPMNMSKARVELVLIFVKVGQVDTVNERYQADIFLQARWREPLLDAMWNKSSLKSKSSWQTNPSIENPFTDLTSKRQLNTLKLQDDEFWNPRLLIDNAEGEPIEIISHEVEFIEPDFEAYLVEKRRIKGIFHETLELRHFPFDCQDLSVTITCDRTTDEVELVASPTEVSQVDVRCAADSQEWKIFHHVDIKSIEIQTGYSPSTSKRHHPGLVFTSRSARRSGYFLVNMILISCVLCLLSFSAFSVPANENRLQLSLLLLLTTVTFKFAASQNLPKISYLTYLDKVVLVNFFMLVILTVWHAIARAVSASKPKFLEYEHYVMYSLLSCYCIGSVLFGLTVYLDAGSRRRLMKRKDIEFNQYKQQIEAEKQQHSILSVSLEEWLNSPHNSITDNLLDKNDP